MNDHDFECEDDECDGLLDAKFTVWDVVVAIFSFFYGVAQAATNATEYLLKSAVGAANREVRQANFADEARMSIEAIPVVGGESDS